MSNGRTGTNGSAVQSVDRALTILSLLAERGDLGVTEIAPPGTASSLRKDPLPRFTDNTIGSLAELQEQLDLVRSRGYATAVDELERGLTAVAAPIFGIDGHVVASVSASGPTFRLPAD